MRIPGKVTKHTSRNALPFDTSVLRRSYWADVKGYFIVKLLFHHEIVVSKACLSCLSLNSSVWSWQTTTDKGIKQTVWTTRREVEGEGRDSTNWRTRYKA